MKNALLISILLLGINSLAYAGGDDRDQQLPLNSLNTEQINEDETPRFLDDDEATQKAQEEIEELIQTKLASPESDVSNGDGGINNDESNLKTKAQLFVNHYVKSDQGILIMLILFVIGLILMFNFFVREK
jgi:hypothetical protein